MDKLSNDLSRIILERKIVNDNVHLVVYADDGGVVFWVSRNLNDPSWFMRYSRPDKETYIQINRHFADAEINVPIRWLSPLIIRNETTLRVLIREALDECYSIYRIDCYDCYYKQGGDQIPPSWNGLHNKPYEKDNSCKNELEPHRFIINTNEEEGIENRDIAGIENCHTIVEQVMIQLMWIIKGLVAEA